MTFWKQLFEGKNGTADEMAVLCVLGVLSYIGLSIYSVVVQDVHFDMQNYGIGLGAALGAASLGMGFKAKQEG